MTDTGWSKREEFLDFWQRRELRFMTAVPYVLLVMCLIADVFMRKRTGAGLALDAACVVASAGLIAVMNRYDKRDTLSCRTRVPLRAAVPLLALLYGLATLLVIQNPTYGFYAWTGYFWAFRLLPGNARFVGVAANAVPVAISQTGGGSYDSVGMIAALVGVWVINGGLATAFSWFGGLGEEQHRRRAQEVTELTEANNRLAEANARLADSLRENADLHERLVSQAREAAVADERRRMAREIHDTLAQGLMGIITQLQAADHGDDPTAERHIQSAIELARESLSEARRSVRALAPEPLASARLPDAVHAVSERWSALHGIPVAFTTTGVVQALRPEAEVALLRTAQEGLANVAKHAHAGRVGLTLSYMEDLVTLDVRDDGVGFDVAEGIGPERAVSERSGGFGLAGMRQRIEGVSGRLAVESEPGAGTAISAAVPVARPTDAPSALNVAAA